MAFVGRLLSMPLMLLVIVVPSYAQSGTIEGRVLGPDGEPFGGATVVIDGQATGAESYQATTDSEGVYELGNLEPGSYRVTLQSRGAAIAIIEGVNIRNGATRELDFDLATIEGADAAVGGAAAREAFDLGMAALNAQDYAAAVEHLTLASETDPTQHVITANLAVALDGAGRVEEAVTAYEKAIELSAATPQAAYYTNVASLYARTGDADKANQAAETLAQLDPAAAGVAYYNIGATLINRGQSVDATTSFSKAIEMDPAMADAYYQLGIAYFGSADTIPDAVPMLEKYLELVPDGPNSEAARGLIAAAQQ